MGAKMEDALERPLLRYTLQHWKANEMQKNLRNVDFFSLLQVIP